MEHESGSIGNAPEDLGGSSLRDMTLNSVMDLVAQQAKVVVPGTSEAGIMLVRAGKITTEALTAEVVKEADDLQFEAGEGPCLHAAAHGDVVECPDLENDDRFPTYGPSVVRTGVRSSLSMPLVLEDRRLGALNMYSTGLSSFTEESRAIAAGLAETAAIVFANAESLHEKAQLADQLRTALETRDVIGMAKGVIMERETVDRKQAFEMLVRLSQTQNKKLREIAEQLVGSVENR